MATAAFRGGVYGFNSGISFTAGGAGIEFRYAHMSRRSASGITFALKVGMLLADGCRTNAMKAAVAIGLGASFAPAPP